LAAILDRRQNKAWFDRQRKAEPAMGKGRLRAACSAIALRDIDLCDRLGIMSRKAAQASVDLARSQIAGSVRLCQLERMICTHVILT